MKEGKKKKRKKEKKQITCAITNPIPLSPNKFEYGTMTLS